MRLRNLLLRWLLVPTLALWAIGFVAAYTRSLAQAHEAYDRTLLGSALVIGEHVTLVDGDVMVELPQAALDMLRTDAQDRIFYRVADLSDNRYITGYEDLPAPERPVSATESVFFDAHYNEQPIRVVALALVRLDGNGKRQLLVEVAETMDARRQLTRRIVSDAAVVQLLLIALAAGSIALGVKRGLAPLVRLRREVQQRDADDLTPIDTSSVPREVAPLIEAINVNTERQRQLNDAQVRFVGNASHQLKTPLTLLRAQIGYALLQTDLPALHSAVKELDGSTAAIGRIVEQLLALARSEPGRLLDMEEFDLTGLARTVSLELQPIARRQLIDLGFDGPQAVPIRGERVLVQELIVNLVHNAVVYTQQGGHVTVTVGLRGDRPVLEVIDDGPGIPVSERARVMERFYRLPGSGTTGSGLGLSIVQEICARHGIAITLGDALEGGTGLQVMLLWPAMQGAQLTGPSASAALVRLR